MRKLIAIWQLMRLEHGVMLALGIFVGSIIALQNQGGISWDSFSWIQFVLTFCTAMFLEASTFALNDYYDLPIDLKNKREDRPLARGDLQPQTAVLLFFIFFPLGLLCSFFVNLTCFIIALITAILAIFYDAYLKKIKLLGNFYIAYVMAIPFVFGASAITSSTIVVVSLDPSVVMIALIAFFCGSGREIMKDVMDFKGDKEAGVKSFPRYIGIRNSNLIAAGFYFIAVLFSIIPFVFPLFRLFYGNYIYLLLVLATDVLLIITAAQLLTNPKMNMSTYRKVTLFAIFLGLLAFFIGAFIG